MTQTSTRNERKQLEPMPSLIEGQAARFPQSIQQSPLSLSRTLHELRNAPHILLWFAIKHPGQAQQHRRGARRALGRAISNAIAVLA